MKTMIALTVLVAFTFACLSCSAVRFGPKRTFQSSFETTNDFSGFYIVPQNHMNSSTHMLTNSKAHGGTFSHIAWIYATNPEGSSLNNQNHRGYPTIQLHKTSGGSYVTPCVVTLWVWLDMPLAKHSPENQWFSIATLSSDSSDNWTRDVLVNLNVDGYVQLMHVPYQGQQQFFYQNTSLKFPQQQWVKVTAYIDFDPDKGYAKVWQDDVLVSWAPVRGCNNLLAQAHFGLYASPSLSAGTVYNDDLTIQETDREPY